MSIYIPGKRMPQNCADCDFCADGWCYVIPADQEQPGVLQSDKRPDWCPLVVVQPHGRLGDLDKLERMFSDIDNAPYSGFDGAEPFYSADDAAQIIRLAPTIIPADPEEGE